MASFRERYGYKPARLEVQLDDLDQETRVGLYNVTYASGLGPCRQQGLVGPWSRWAARIWTNVCSGRLDERPVASAQMEDLAQRIILNGAFDLAMEFMQAVAEEWPDAWLDDLRGYKESWNDQAERFMVGYRFVGNEILKVSDPQQVQAMENAQRVARQIPAAQQHLQAAARLLADRKRPDYRNSIKESVSAVEAVVRQVSGDDKATLGQALKKLPDLHPALKDAWSRLYGYTSDADGIRHAASDDGKPVDQALALYFLTSCSAFVTFLLSEAGT